MGTTKQNIHQRLNRELKRAEEEEQLKVVLRQVREDHPQMGCKELYRRIKPQTMGRDKFFEFYRSYGFKITPQKCFRRTTDSSGVMRFPNLVTGRELTGVNQVWVSDITYYEMNSKFYYLTFILDQYSRRIIGYSASRTLRTEDTTIPALKMALTRIKGDEIIKPIIHSDGGGQYYSKEFLSLTRGCLRNSMCETVYENPHAERINGTIKNGYIKGYNPTDFKSLIRKLDKAVYMYNNEKGHSSIDHFTPVEFEQRLKKKLVILE
ncbi:DDE-type integrase/transposase/recombinase [Salinimicrobium sp. CDJ15-81-2]|nr:DDE-type integrase/transposase/recombinase [Salinimicrobium nanhaiense]